ncbi:sugar ABC transporter permease [Paenibacillus xerothermodurans]|uniref:Sugar ABC transporter permease n=1 Tax=Paenibacillus xerothermodurans TaxID=1977292 RepID=A0A2W1NE92_PAEXE|nr:sugar ABC transporter permease [Paenibacillus xerothermodurans]
MSPARKKPTMKDKEARLGYLLIAPSLILIAIVILYPVIYNITLSFQNVALNPRRSNTFIGFDNYVALLTDPSLWHSLWVTLIYTTATVIGATVLGVAVALLLNQQLKGRRLYRSVVLLPYVAPIISLVFVWQYMFNPVYGMVNYTLVQQLGVLGEYVDWLDSPNAALTLVSVFDIWHLFPFCFMMVLAKLQSIDQTVYEAAEIDGAGGWNKFRFITMPEVQFVVGSLMILRFIWNFYKFDDVYLLTKEVPVVGVYTYELAFTTFDHGLAAAITVTLFILIMVFVLFAVRKVLKW